jgi:SPP1 gp7 family putative phage head morphogenesis protein
MLIVNINAETRRAIRDIVLSGFQVGKHPYQMAEEIQALVGMTPGQVRAYQAFAQNMAKGNLSANGQDVALAAYRTRAIEHRARNIARTETLRAANAGQLTLWDKADADGLLGPSARRVWINTPDQKICPFCDELGDKTTGLKTPWMNEGIAVPAPPAHPSCRCAMGLEFGLGL